MSAQILESPQISLEEIEKQIQEKQKEVAFDTIDMPLEYILNKYKKGDLYVPLYQRDFVWNQERQSKLIESIILGIPIPVIFVADDGEGRMEIVDGSQRIRTIVDFMENKLQLNNLTKLGLLNGLRFENLTGSRKRRIENTTLRAIKLSEKSDEEVRRDLFERINTGSDELRPSEKRKGIYQGAFADFIWIECAKNPLFNELVPLTERTKVRGEAPELILRFFAIRFSYPHFPSGVKFVDFLDNFLQKQNIDFGDSKKAEYLETFIKMLEFIKKHFGSFARFEGSLKTPRLRFEALSVGVSLALQNKANLSPSNINWVDSSEFQSHISGDGTSSFPKITKRIEFVRDNLLK